MTEDELFDEINKIGQENIPSDSESIVDNSENDLGEFEQANDADILLDAESSHNEDDFPLAILQARIRGVSLLSRDTQDWSNRIVLMQPSDFRGNLVKGIVRHIDSLREYYYDSFSLFNYWTTVFQTNLYGQQTSNKPNSMNLLLSPTL